MLRKINLIYWTSKYKSRRNNLRIIFLTILILSVTSSHLLNAQNKHNKSLNRLAHESSPYLLQHADNPVDWYPWGAEAFKKAKELNRPIFLSIGYSTCHWCHVMEQESFEDTEIAKLLNDNFISIKVDREELPEVDHVYMSVCQALTGHGGWPLTIIMTPSKEPFYAGTYFPKETRGGRIGLKQLLPSISKAWKNQQNELETTISRIKDYLNASNQRMAGTELTDQDLISGFKQFTSRYDNIYGGFGDSPKFPSPHNLIFLLRYYSSTNNKTALEMVENTLQHMRRGGIYDHIGFGFHRYSTDREWLVPHFEKMLYDQAMLSMVYTEAYEITRNKFYQQTAQEILDYVLREMTSEKGAFFSAEDADSDGEEGKFYFWKTKEIETLIGGSDLEFISKIYGLSDSGNFKNEITAEQNGENIFHQNQALSEIESLSNFSPTELENRWQSIRKILFELREKRIHPFKDDKILTDWNGLMIAAFAKAARVYKNNYYLEAAEKAEQFINNKMYQENGRLYRRFRNGEAGIEGHLDDYAFLTWGLIELYNTTFKAEYFEKAVSLTDMMINEFWDIEKGGFFLGGNHSEKILIRSKTGYDGAIPSGNSVAVMNLQKLSRMTGLIKYGQMAEKTTLLYSKDVRNSPSSFTHLLNTYIFSKDPKEVVVVGSGKNPATDQALQTIQNHYTPNMIILFKDTDTQNRVFNTSAKWTENHLSLNEKLTFYICKDFVCNQPTTDLKKALVLINE